MESTTISENRHSYYVTNMHLVILKFLGIVSIYLQSKKKLFNRDMVLNNIAYNNLLFFRIKEKV